MSRSFSTIDFFFSYYAPKNVIVEDLSLTKTIIRCLAALAVVPIGSFTFRNIKSDIFLILMHTLFYLLGSILFVSGILGGGKVIFIVGYGFIKVAFALFSSLTLKFLVSYTNCWRYLSFSKYAWTGSLNLGSFFAMDSLVNILHNCLLKDLSREVDFNVLTFTGFYSIIFTFLLLFLSYKCIFARLVEVDTEKNV